MNRIAAGAGLFLLVLLGAALVGPYDLPLLGLADAALIGVIVHRRALRWEFLVGSIAICIMLIPIGRYELPGNLPFNVEPYRILVALVAVAWLASLLAQPDTRWRRTGLFLPLAALTLTIIISLGLNISRLAEPGVEPYAMKQVSLFASFLVVMLLTCSVITTRDRLHAVLKALSAGGGIVGFLSIIEYRTGFNVFDHLHTVIPVLKENAAGLVGTLQERGGGARIYGSAQHPIALSAALMMLIPISFYVAATFRKKRWALAAAFIVLAALGTVARTGISMLVFELITVLAIKPSAVLRMWRYVIPVLIIAHIAVPQSLGGLKSAFFPAGGIVAEQQYGAGQTSSNRLADVGPSLKEWKKTPAFGQGFGTRITVVNDPHRNALILDDQWLGSLLEIGAVGVLALLWLFTRSVRRLGRAARRDPTPFGWLPAALAAAITGFGIGMLTFDAFAFTQVTFLLFIVIGLGVSACRLASMPAARRGGRTQAAH
jgi:hypothetical protein